MRNSSHVTRLAVIISALAIIGAASLLLPQSVAGTKAPPQTGAAHSDDPQPPWKASETIDPPTLAKALPDPKAPAAAIIVCVGFHTLYEGAHIPGASFHGAASTAKGLDDLKQWAKPLPRTANIVIYCGCCPLAHCPNARPAFVALRDMGFSHLRVLILPHDFASDWVQPGYPITKGK